MRGIALLFFIVMNHLFHSIVIGETFQQDGLSLKLSVSSSKLNQGDIIYGMCIVKNHSDEVAILQSESPGGGMFGIHYEYKYEDQDWEEYIYPTKKDRVQCGVLLKRALYLDPHKEIAAISALQLFMSVSKPPHKIHLRAFSNLQKIRIYSNECEMILRPGEYVFVEETRVSPTISVHSLESSSFYDGYDFFISKSNGELRKQLEWRRDYIAWHRAVTSSKWDEANKIEHNWRKNMDPVTLLIYEFGMVDTLRRYNLDEAKRRLASLPRTHILTSAQELAIQEYLEFQMKKKEKPVEFRSPEVNIFE